MATAVTIQGWTWRMTAMAVIATVGLVVAGCAGDDATETDAADPPLEAPEGAQAPSEAPAVDDDPAGAAEGSALEREWADIADAVREAMSEHGLASEQFSQARDDALRTGVGLLPAGMPVPDVASTPTAGISPSAPDCAAEFAITLGLYHAADRPYEFAEATEWFDAGLDAAGWSAQTVDLVGPDHPFAGEAEGIGYTVQTDEGTWYVTIMTHHGTDLAYCPVG